MSCVATLLAALFAEGLRWSDPVARTQALTGWLCGERADWLPFLPWLLLFPVVVWGARMRPRSPLRSQRWTNWLLSGAEQDESPAGAWQAALTIFLLAFAASRLVGASQAGLPPAYHDEYSYLFQAQTFLAGRTWFPSFSPQPALFDQMHVLNVGHFASRYFPGAGVWLAPFVALGDPWLGQQLAHGLAAMLMFWIGRELSCHGVGLLGGLLYALSPGLLLFSNLLLAHQPTLVGLLLFAWALFRWLRTGGTWLALLAGTALSFAMLCRPMTAAGFALPFGLVLLSWLIAGRPLLPWMAHAPSTRGFLALGRWPALLALGAPLLVGFVILLSYNNAVTGSALVSPYQLYTDLYTPRHRYGFHNVTRGERNLGPHVLDNYDRWAEDLDAPAALRNVRERLIWSVRWALGLVPVLLGSLVVLLSPRAGTWRWSLVWASILSLHLVHVPYWFVGIMGWHYVLETAPLWLLLFAEGSKRLCQGWAAIGKTAPVWGWGVLIALALVVNLATVRPLWPGRLEQALAETSFPRQRYQTFRQRVEQFRDGRPVVVFIISDPSDRHIDYVTNPPDLAGPVLVARLPDRTRLAEFAALFPDRQLLVFDAARREFLRR